MIRQGEKYCFVEACLDLGMDKDNIIVSREISETGRNLCKINGRMVTTSELKEFMKHHLDIHGQFDSQLIMDESNHISYLDDFSLDELKDYKSEYLKYYEEYLDINKKLKENYGDEKLKERTLDLLKYEYNEIENASLKIGEEESLNEKYELVKNSEKINEALGNSQDIVNQKIMRELDDVLKNLSKVSNISEKYSKFLELARDSYYTLEELNLSLDSELQNIDLDVEDAESI